MSRGYKYFLAALAGLALIAVTLGVGAYFGALNAPHYDYQSTHSANRSAKNEQPNSHQINRDRAGLPYFAERITAGPDPADGTDREKRDLAAQESMSVWTFWLLLVSAFGTVVATIGTTLLLIQINLTRAAVIDTSKATEAMERQNEIAQNAQRPWVSIESKLTDFKIIGVHGVSIKWEVTYTNIGQMVAEDMRADVQFVPMGKDAEDRIEEWKENSRNTELPIGISLIPGETTRSYGESNYSIDYLPWFGEEPRRCYLTILVIVSYCIPSRIGRRYATRCFVIGRNGDNMLWTRTFTDELTLDVSKEDLTVHRYGGGYSD